jgi:hypothetical protein
MTFGNINRRIGLTAILCAGMSCVGAHLQADFEIESFARYRLIRLDNNNNGYVDDFDITDPVGAVEFRTIAEAIDKTSTAGSFDYSLYRPQQSPYSPVRDLQGNLIGIAVDYDDLHTFNIAFESLKGFTYLQGRGVQLEKVIRFSPKVREGETEPEEPYPSWEFFYGVRFYRFDDSFTFEGNGGILGHTWADTSVENQHGGPHLGMLWNLRHGRWTLAVSGLAQSGLGATDSRQAGRMGEDLSPGQVNSPIYAQPHIVSYQVEDRFDTVYGEVRAQVKRELSKLISLTLGCSGYYYGDIKFADQSVNWFIPDLGVLTGTEDSTVTTAFATLEFRH